MAVDNDVQRVAQMNMWDWLDLMSYKQAEAKYQEILYEQNSNTNRK